MSKKVVTIGAVLALTAISGAVAFILIRKRSVGTVKSGLTHATGSLQMQNSNNDASIQLLAKQADIEYLLCHAWKAYAQCGDSNDDTAIACRRNRKLIIDGKESKLKSQVSSNWSMSSSVTWPRITGPGTPANWQCNRM